jgi:hypothetical protein
MLFSLLGKPAAEPDVPFSTLECCGGKASPGSLCQVSTIECHQYQHWSSRATALMVSITNGFASANPGHLDMVNAKGC